MNTRSNLSRLLISACAIGGMMTSAIAATQTAAVSEKLKAAFALAGSERVAVIALGDSNQRFGGHGYSHYMARALNEKYGCYGSGLTIYRENRAKDAPPPPIAPQEIAEQAYGRWYVPPGEEGQVNWANGQLIISPEAAFGITGNLRFHLYYGTFGMQAEGGAFSPVVRRDTPPWTVLASASMPVQSVTGSFGVDHFSLDLPASSERKWQLQFMPVAAGQSVRGPFLASLASCENTDRETGVSYNTLYAVGGKSVRDMVLKLRESTPAQMDNYFVAVRQLLNGHKTAVVMICSGLNDRNDHAASQGPSAGLDSSSPEGYADNLQAVVDILQAAWVRTGGTVETLRFAFMPSHALGDPDDAKLVSYREAASALAARLPNASSIDLSTLVPYKKMAEGKYYDRGLSSGAHLSKEGYAAIADALVGSLDQ